ncbi:TIGR00341 family protein [Chitinophaga qingshengii]|uniref:TIGR00341 family protein n=1 Tax=Chitinophaga qingshengii TaxID=1569794 RepID=A0ABR7TNN2_9BACT|nr:TIGR00341 family protein [Chitinophaga qingshengii]MBC9932089.1 TIGR00341 family protein [Chitinophaga qingshengii]
MIKSFRESRVWRRISITLQRRFNLNSDTADEGEVISSITNSSEFKGANLWTLIFAIFIASIGLNVNSTAVIIGAMLISPLMGPIMGIGLGVGINDFDLLKKGSRNLLIATVISIATSTLYFLITPLHDAQSELLARTTPSVWDVFIAFVGGLAGIVAATRQEKSNVIPGVAIATALMPPLCTAGYGLANGNLLYFAGALYLYFINSIFICLSTFLIVRFLHFRKRRFEDKSYERKVSRYILIITTLTVVPSIYLAYRIVDKSIFENNARNFVRDAFNFTNTQVVNRNFLYHPQHKEINLLLIGAELSDTTIERIRASMGQYKLPHTQLVVRQGLNARQEIDFSQIKASILEDVFRQDSSRQANTQAASPQQAPPDLTGEMKALFPNCQYYAASPMVFRRPDSSSTDTCMVVMAGFSRKIKPVEKIKVQNWLKQRLSVDSVRLVIQ